MDTEDSGSLLDQLRSRTRSREGVPMEEQARRASRFVRLQAEGTESEKPPLTSKQQRQWRLARKRVEHLRNLLEQAEHQLEELSAPPSDQTNRTHRD